MSRLKPEAQQEVYKRWLKEFDYTDSRQLESVLSYRTYRIEGAFLVGHKPYDYLKMIEVSSLIDYRCDQEQHLAAKAIAEQWRDYLEVADSLYGEFIPPGMIIT